MSFLRRLFGKSKQDEVAPPPPPKPAVDFSKAGIFLDCEGVDWNPAGQREFMEKILAPHSFDRLLRLLESEDFTGNPHCNPADAAVLFAVIGHYEPSRIMEVGCGYTTRVIRSSKDSAMMPGELIAIDPEPRAELIEFVDAHLADRLEDVPVDDFRILQEGELVFIDLPHEGTDAGPLAHFFKHVLPAIGPGVLVGFHGMRLPRNYTREELEQGSSGQELLLEYLKKEKPEVIFSGGWTREHEADLLKECLPVPSRDHDVTAFWMRTR
ncbi:MAG: hypothetical protein JJU11_17340 [Candidatus Sumerlaeia bacterium]|nr:hypothetical protein [Candidatus Sumerlaeia bacterium]